MKTKLLSLAGVAVCIAALSSCAPYYDDYGYAGGGYYGGAPLVNRGVIVDPYGYGGFGGYGPVYSNVGFFGMGGRGLWGNTYHRQDHYYHGSGYRQSPANHYASRVARPSSHRGTVSNAPPRIPSASAPRQVSRPSAGSLSRPSSSRPSSSVRPSSPSVRPSSPSVRPSSPSVRPSSPSVRATTTSSRPSMSRSAPPSASSSRPSGDRRSR